MASGTPSPVYDARVRVRVGERFPHDDDNDDDNEQVAFSPAAEPPPSEPKSLATGVRRWLDESRNNVRRVVMSYPRLRALAAVGGGGGNGGDFVYAAKR